MTTDQQASLKFPIGPFTPLETINTTELNAFVETVESAPARYRALTEKLPDADLQKTYREGSWNIQQLVNHVADMQMLHFFRMKKALTEPDYKELTLVSMDGWANTADGLFSSVEDSLTMFEAITRRYVLLMQSLDARQLEITYYHPIRKINLSQKHAISMSAWHVRHHLEHIKIALAS
jgi:uncharacterized damage-inducible protein DinB